ncbi:DUF4199 domain-containing protein [Halpernia frigidisoli]|uniref:DUF4199 domain-containing protein n=1 Tax=Halpernia frigidisoli TaxID=1125876 RepID=A0A1I3IIW2_9FLAO|nr:DUF4199 domain-containing protein [Halpernia frigidisoli]SFI47852.1 Protein of unknown function [Halpernia frigidisoli]
MRLNIIQKGLMLFIITMIIFFLVYYFFGDLHYFDNTMMANSFVMPIVYALVAFFSVRNIWKKENTINFSLAFKNAFLPMFIGGFLSILSIFIFLNYLNTPAKDLLNYQYVSTQKAQLDEEYSKSKKILAKKEDIADLEQKYQERLQSFAPERVKDKDMFTARFFMLYFAAILIYDLIFSLFIGAFFRSRSAK